MQLRPAHDADLDRVLAINEANVPAVGRIPREQLTWFLEHARTFQVAEVDGELAGFLIALTPDAPYGSVHFGWFRDRYDRFLYVDRIAIDAPFHRRGLGQRFYAELAAIAASEGHERVTAEVNIEPPNDASLAFHRTLGFTDVGTQDASDGKRVTLLVQEL